MIKFKKLQWKGENPNKGINTSVIIFTGPDKDRRLKISFEIKTYADKLYLADYQKEYYDHLIDITSVEEGKELAQKTFEKFCQEILNNICDQ